MKFLATGLFASATLMVAGDLRPDHIVAAARSQIGITLSYDDSYKRIPYPNGDFSQLTGCCTDVIIRAYRKFKIDLQSEVHKDILKHQSRYKSNLTNGRPDRNIDHRRVGVLNIFFSTNSLVLPNSKSPSDYQPGDIVVWKLPTGRLHIGLVSDDFSANEPMIIHNIGYGVKSDPVLFFWQIIGHYRYFPLGA